MDNNINLADIYGLNKSGENLAYTGNVVPNIPSLEQIAFYNIEQARLNQIANNSTTKDNATARDINYDGISRNYLVSEQGSDYTLTPNLTPPNNMMSSQDEFTIIPEYGQPYPVTAESIQYLNGFMRTQIGRKIDVEFLIGSDDLVEKTGYLLGVGANYILINEVGTNNLTSCDFYNIKFVTYYYE